MRTLDDALRDCIALIFDLEKKRELAEQPAAQDAYAAVAARLRDIFSDVPGIDLDILRAHRQLVKQHLSRDEVAASVSLKQTRTVTLQAGTWTLPNGRQVIVPSGETLQIEVPINEWYEHRESK